MKANSSRVAVLIAALTCACSPRGGDPAWTATDSAGVRIVEHPAPAAKAAGVTLEEVARIGAADSRPETLFSNIPGGRILEDGTVVLVDQVSREVRQFTADGAFIRAHGREGEGPGEYEFIRGVGQCSRSGLTVFDIGWTMSLYDGMGDFVTERVIRLEEGGTPYHMACDRAGRIAAMSWDRSAQGGPQPGFHVARARLRVLDVDGTELLDLGERIGSERWGTRNGTRPHPGGRSTKFGFQESDLIVSDGSFFGYERWNEEGRLAEIVRIRVPPPDIDSMAVAYLDSTLARAQDDETRTRWRQQVTEMEWPPRASYFSDLFVTPERILLRELSVGTSGRWFEFTQDGTPIGYLPLPPGATLLDVRGDLILVEERDAMDVPSGVLYARNVER